MKVLNCLALSTGLLLPLTGCLSTQQPEMTQAEKQQVYELQQAMINKIKAASVNTQVVQQASLPTNANMALADVNQISEAELAKQYHQLISTGHAATFKTKKDGLLINDKLYLDPEGQIVSYGSDTKSGNFTYLIKKYDGTYGLKASRAGSNMDAITIATIYQQGNKELIETVTGKKLYGQDIIPTSDGVIVSRDQSVFQYKIGSKVTSSSSLDNFHIAPLQKGDIAGTGYILLEKNPDKENSIDGLVSSFTSIGRSFGMTKKFDYVLLNINDGATIPLDVDLQGKEVATHSQCRRKNDYVNECANVSFSEALFDKTGQKTWGHYFWTIDWVNGESGPIVIYRNSTQLLAIDVQSNQAHELFSRTLGVNDHEIEQHLDGTISVSVGLGFDRQKLDDIESFIKQRKSTNIKPVDELEL